MSKKVIITGATGLLGRKVVQAFEEAGWQVTGAGYTRAKPPLVKLDLLDEDEVCKLLDEVKPSVLVHCAAEKSPDRCANDVEGTIALNVKASSMLAKQTGSRGVLLIYISTDYVFDGRPGAAPYEADAETSPPNFYGETKRDGERAILEASEKAVVVRVPLLYGSGENSESAVNVLMDAIWNKAGKEKIEMDHWAIRCKNFQFSFGFKATQDFHAINMVTIVPTNTEDVARVLKDVAEKYTSSDSSSFPKILQFSSEDNCTKYEICQRLSQVLTLPIPHIVPNDKVDPNSSVIRPYDCHLSTKLLKDLGISVATMEFEAWWKRELRAFR